MKFILCVLIAATLIGSTAMAVPAIGAKAVQDGGGGNAAQSGGRLRLLRLPHGLLSPAEFAEFFCPQMCLINREELIQLGGLDSCSGKHGVCLPPMMDLMLKQMHQQTIAPFGLHPRFAIDLHHLVETV